MYSFPLFPRKKNNQTAAYSLPSDINELPTPSPHLTMKGNGQGACKGKAAAKAATATLTQSSTPPLAGSCGLFVPPNYFNPGWYHLVPRATEPSTASLSVTRDTIQISSMPLSDDPRRSRGCDRFYLDCFNKRCANASSECFHANIMKF